MSLPTAANGSGDGAAGKHSAVMGVAACAGSPRNFVCTARLIVHQKPRACASAADHQAATAQRARAAAAAAAAAARHLPNACTACAWTPCTCAFATCRAVWWCAETVHAVHVGKLCVRPLGPAAEVMGSTHGCVRLGSPCATTTSRSHITFRAVAAHDRCWLVAGDRACSLCCSGNSHGELHNSRGEFGTTPLGPAAAPPSGCLPAPCTHRLTHRNQAPPSFTRVCWVEGPVKPAGLTCVATPVHGAQHAVRTAVGVMLKCLFQARGRL